MEQLDLSVRPCYRILKDTRTLADLAGSEYIPGNRILEGIQCRSLGRKLFA